MPTVYSPPQSTYTKIATTSLSGGEASITFNYIPNTHKDLVLIMETRLTSGSPNANQIVRFNNDNSAAYPWVYMSNTVNSSANGGSNTSSTSLLVEVSQASSASSRNQAIVNIFNNSIVGQEKPILVREGSGTYNTNGGTGAISTTWRSIYPVDKITITLTNVNSYFDATTKISLYGIAG
jgi:hypothetical protein